MALIERTGVGAVSGRGFYSTAADHHMLRFCFARPQSALDQACRRLRSLDS